MRKIIAMFTVLLSASFAIAQDAKDLPPIKPIPRLLPPKGIDIGKEERDKLESRLAALTKEIKEAKLDKELGPDVEVYMKAVRWAIDFDEFYDAKKDIAKAHAALDTAQKRLDAIKAGKPAWHDQRGLLVRGYRSDIDDSVQPYGLHIPHNLDLSKPVPLLVWLHGRGDKETDLHFIANREKSKGEFAPDWCITLHPYGRGTIGFKFAGEIDVLDAIESVKKRYKVDEDRIALAGFSMGGAGAWHIGAHYADKFCVVHAGAGFVETAKYNRLTPDKYPAWYEQRLWGWYDVPCYTRNLFNVPVIAYSGENDKQKQAADLMAEAFKAEGRELRHIIGPGVEHKYEAKAKEQVLKEIKAAVEKGREKWPKEVHLQTRTLEYKRMHWIEVQEFGERWKEARVDASWVAERKVSIKTANVRKLVVYVPSTQTAEKFEVVIDGKAFHEKPNGHGVIEFWKREEWKPFPPAMGHETDYNPFSVPEGPIDVAFCRPFLVVVPSKVSSSASVQRWLDFELHHFKERWRATFRGDLRIKSDLEVNANDLDSASLVLWGEPSTNSLIAKELRNTNIRWSASEIHVGGRDYPAKGHMLSVLGLNTHGRKLNDRGDLQISPQYIVLNSGPTFREGHDRTNSQQTPKLPDWAIIGLDKDPDALSPGEIKAAGFFDENWQVKKQEEK